jgi:outer membrane protein TolC
MRTLERRTRLLAAVEFEPLVAAFLVTTLLSLTGCAIHPAGESAERERAEREGEPFTRPRQERELPQLPTQATWRDVVRLALLASPRLEESYWQWRAALERIPQEGSPKTTGAIFFEQVYASDPSDLLERTSLAAGNDPMFNLPWPGKLSSAARRALEEARAAAERFTTARFEVRKEALMAYLDWTLLAELIRIEEANVALLDSVLAVVETRARVGAAPQRDLLWTGNQRDLAANELERLRSQVPGKRARINGLLDRAPDAPLVLPAVLPEARRLPHGDAEVLRLMAERNPELRELARGLDAAEEGILLAQLDFVPELGISAGTDLAGAAQSIGGMVTAPLLRFEAIAAGIAQAEAELAALEAARRRVENDVEARAVLDLHALRDFERQIALFVGALVPRAEQHVIVVRASHEAGQAPLIEVFDAQRTLLDIRRTLARLRIEREEILADIETLIALELDEGAS